MKKMKLKVALAAALTLAGASLPALALPFRHGLTVCRVTGVEHEAYCGKVTRPLDPARSQGLQIEVHFVVIPALARNRLPDPVFFFAGGPGQSAIDLAGPMSRLIARLGNRRDLVFIGQHRSHSDPHRDLPGGTAEAALR